MLFLDMDGVLMDFEGAITAGGVVPYPDSNLYLHRPRSEWPLEMVAADAAYVALMDSPDFWPSIKPMTDAHELWSYCRAHHPHILSAVPNKTKNRALVETDKRESIWRYFDPVFPHERIHLCLRSEKVLWARKDHILVDDNRANCEEWHRAGGTPIHHKDAKTTIAQLQEILNDRR